MISRQELKYVSYPAKDIPFPGSDYAYDVINRLAKALKTYKEKYEGKTYCILLSDGEEISFEIKNKNLAHLLGIDYKTLINDENMKNLLHSVLGFDNLNDVNSYSILNHIIDYADRVIDNDDLSFDKILNYYKIMVKVSCFEALSEFDKFNFGYIDFDKKTFERNINSDYLPNSIGYIFCPSNEKLIPYCMMGLKYEKESDMMIPETFIAPPDFSNFLYRQDLLLPVQLLISDDVNLSKYVATAEEKINMLNIYKSLIQNYNTESFINIFGDYENMLREKVKKL